MAWWMPVLAALGVNAGKNILTGQDPLKNAAQAGITGGITGGLLNNTIPGAEVSGAGGVTSDTTNALFNNAIPGSLESEGLLQFNQATGTYLDPSQYVGESIGMPTFTGGQGLLSNAADEVGSMFGNLTPENLSGVASLLGEQQDTGQYRQMAGTGGGVKQGSGQGLSVQMPQAKIFKRRKV